MLLIEIIGMTFPVHSRYLSSRARLCYFLKYTHLPGKSSVKWGKWQTLTSHCYVLTCSHRGSSFSYVSLQILAVKICALKLCFCSLLGGSEPEGRSGACGAGRVRGRPGGPASTGALGPARLCSASVHAALQAPGPGRTPSAQHENSRCSDIASSCPFASFSGLSSKSLRTPGS